jgi:hypothetical protein
MTTALQGLIVATGLIVLHAPDGHEVFVNPDEVTVLHQKLGAGKDTFTANASCLVNMTDGKFITVVETCLTVLKALDNPTLIGEPPP